MSVGRNPFGANQLRPLKRIRTLIADDEPLTRAALELLAKADDELELVGSCADGAAALDAIRRERVELAFLDVQMPGMDGFEVLAALPSDARPRVVFITGHEKHALQAFDVNAVDYLLKPFTAARFVTALQRAKETLRQQHTAELTRSVETLLERVRRLERAEEPAARPPAASGSNDRIVLKAQGSLHFIRPEDVIWIEAQGDFVKVQTDGKAQLVRETLRTMEQRLDPARFLRIHRSFVVNLEHVRRVETALYGDYSVYMSDGTKLRLSRNYRGKLRALVRESTPWN